MFGITVCRTPSGAASRDWGHSFPQPTGPTMFPALWVWNRLTVVLCCHVPSFALSTHPGFVKTCFRPCSLLLPLISAKIAVEIWMFFWQHEKHQFWIWKSLGPPSHQEDFYRLILNTLSQEVAHLCRNRLISFFQAFSSSPRDLPVHALFKSHTFSPVNQRLSLPSVLFGRSLVKSFSSRCFLSLILYPQTNACQPVLPRDNHTSTVGSDILGLSIFFPNYCVLLR